MSTLNNIELYFDKVDTNEVYSFNAGSNGTVIRFSGNHDMLLNIWKSFHTLLKGGMFENSIVTIYEPPNLTDLIAIIRSTLQLSVKDIDIKDIKVSRNEDKRSDNTSSQITRDFLWNQDIYDSGFIPENNNLYENKMPTSTYSSATDNYQNSVKNTNMFPQPPMFVKSNDITVDIDALYNAVIEILSSKNVSVPNIRNISPKGIYSQINWLRSILGMNKSNLRDIEALTILNKLRKEWYKQ